MVDAFAPGGGNAATATLLEDDAPAGVDGTFVTAAFRFANMGRSVRREAVDLEAGTCYRLSAQTGIVRKRGARAAVARRIGDARLAPQDAILTARRPSMNRPKPATASSPVQKRPRAGPRPLRMPEPIDASPEDIARACMMGPPKRDSDYTKAQRQTDD